MLISDLMPKPGQIRKPGRKTGQAPFWAAPFLPKSSRPLKSPLLVGKGRTNVGIRPKVPGPRKH